MDNSELSTIIIGKLMNIGGMLQRDGNRILLPFDLNQQQFSIFYEIAKANKVKQKDMVNRLLLEKAHVSKVVKKLQKMELITVKTLEEDKRSAWLSPTQKGNEVIKKCMTLFAKLNNEWLGSIENKQLMSILENITQLQDIFKNRIQNEVKNKYRIIKN